MLQARQLSIKLLANSFSGYLGFFMSRWYSNESAKSMTSWGRYYVTQVIEKAKKQGFDVLYGDTDSVFLSLKGLSREKAKAFVDEVNIELPELMELELENYFVDGIFVSTKNARGGAKKRYALLSKEGIIKIRGFETVRRDWSLVAKETQMKVLNFILKDKSPEKAFDYVKQIIDKLRKKEISIDKVTMFTQIQKNIEDYESIGPHVSAAKLMQKKGELVGPGTMVRYIVVKGNGPIRDRVKLPEDIKENEYDDEYYIKNQVIPAVETILAVFGYNAEQLIQDGSQKGLGGWI